MIDQGVGIENIAIDGTRVPKVAIYPCGEEELSSTAQLERGKSASKSTYLLPKWLRHMEHPQDGSLKKIV